MSKIDKLMVFHVISKMKKISNFDFEPIKLQNQYEICYIFRQSLRMENSNEYCFFILLLFHTCRRQETNILSPEGLRMSNSAVYY